MWPRRCRRLLLMAVLPEFWILQALTVHLHTLHCLLPSFLYWCSFRERRDWLVAAANFSNHSELAKENGMAKHQIQDLIKTMSWFIVVAAVAAAATEQRSNPFTTRFSTFLLLLQIKNNMKYVVGFSFAWFPLFAKKRSSDDRPFEKNWMSGGRRGYERCASNKDQNGKSNSKATWSGIYVSCVVFHARFGIENDIPHSISFLFQYIPTRPFDFDWTSCSDISLKWAGSIWENMFQERRNIFFSLLNGMKFIKIYPFISIFAAFVCTFENWNL